jgi:hypothetical protein
VEVAAKFSGKKSASKPTPREAAATAKKGKVPTLKIKFGCKKGWKVSESTLATKLSWTVR